VADRLNAGTILGAAPCDFQGAGFDSALLLDSESGLDNFGARSIQPVILNGVREVKTSPSFRALCGKNLSSLFSPLATASKGSAIFVSTLCSLCPLW